MKKLVILIMFLNGCAMAGTNLERIYEIAFTGVAPICYVENKTPKIIGTGFFVTKDGYFLTCNHILSDRDKNDLSVLLFETTNQKWAAYFLEVVDKDSEHDIALLRLKICKTSDEAVGYIKKIGNSNKIKPGNAISFCGFPAGETLSALPTIHAGIISSIKSSKGGKGDENFDRLFQLDASSTGGFSGSPLFLNETKEVIGIVKGYFQTEKAISFAIPIEYANEMLSKIKDKNKQKSQSITPQ